MFGGHRSYVEGLIVAISLGGELMLKGDAKSELDFLAAGSRRWTYRRDGKAPVAMPYYTLPCEGYDDPDAMAAWAHRAFDAARRSPRKAPRWKI